MYPQHFNPWQTAHYHAHHPGPMVSTRRTPRDIAQPAPTNPPSEGHLTPNPLNTPPAQEIDPRFTGLLPMIYGADLTISHLSQDADTFTPFYRGRNSRVRADNDPTLDPVQGFIHPDDPIYKYGGPVYRVQHPTFGLMDTMVCNTDVCAVCNFQLPIAFAVPGPEESPTQGLPFVHTLRDCREVEEDGALQFWQTARHALFVEEYPASMERARVRFVNVGMLATREAMCCVPEECGECKGLVGMERLESQDGSLVVWKKKEGDGGGEKERAGEKDGDGGKKRAGSMGPPPKPQPK
ncbi:hypothetical protein M409DRAFT_29605 [Zasmidium cellare ATCC 36951]|uniref:Uncharacterized protein n=1 Tax=Zasmidium cellare ATCC 36951 TaxID=1080233 RepID=A0A6A6C2B5_ZASCE|nr:uncharacterized protein M409DRAFT_29605 [Zasmidium cellare ATCC 36951]KAF2159992.1 hypothetical protein M409DRAFT_29605 [Zasmidium cellare ATCC 36951]